MNKDELKARLLAEAEKAIDEMLAEKPAAGSLSLADIERLALKSGAQFEAGILKELGQEESEIENSHDQICEHCGSRMQRRGRSGRGPHRADVLCVSRLRSEPFPPWISAGVWI